MRELDRRGFASALSALRTPLLGICLGLQLLFERSEEEGGVRCLGLLPGRVRRLAGAPRLPHMGWNRAQPRARHPILAGWHPEGEWFYFAHSYGCDCPAEVVLAETVYGPPFASAAGFHLVCGVQFHPEKSSAAGLRVLAAFLDRAGVQVGEAGGPIGTAPPGRDVSSREGA